ncbi:MAG: ABC transporter substrate-binding protein [Sulfolobales archaeon]
MLKTPIKIVTTLIALAIVLGLIQSASATSLPPPPPDEAHLGDYWFRYGPHVDKLAMPLMKDYTMRLLAFEAGEISITGVTAADLDRVRRNRPDAHIIFTAGTTSSGHLRFNTQLWPVKYLELRQALAHLWDRNRMISESPLRGIAIKCTTIVPPTHGRFMNPNADFEKLYPYDPEKAKELLAKVFVPCTAPDGKPAWCDPREGNRVVEWEIWVLPEATSPTYWWIAQYIKSEAEKIGLRVRVKPVSTIELDAARAAGTVPSWVSGWSFARYPTFLYYFFHSRELRPGGWNEYKVNNSKLDEILDKFIFADSIDEAIKWAWEAQEILVKEVIPWIPTYTSVGITAFDGKLDRSTIILVYAPPAELPTDTSWFWWSSVRYKDRKFGGTLVYYHSADVGTYHPATYRWTTEADAIARVYPALSYSYPPNMYDEENKVSVFFEYYKAEKVKYPAAPDGEAVRITIKLFEGIRWQDGVEMTVDDIEYTLIKFGKELKTRRYYGPDIDMLLEIRKINKTTVELYFDELGWADRYYYKDLRILPKHIFERLPDPLMDPAKAPHPFIPGLTAMIGAGPWVLVKREPAYTEFVWNPWYYWRHPDRTVKFAEVSIPSAADEGKPFKLSITLADYLGNRATNASITIKISGPMTLTLTATHVGAGVYEATVPGLRAGTYTIEFYAEQPIMLWSVDNKYTAKITVGAVVGPGPVGPTIERPPTVIIEIPGIPPVEISPPPAISLSPPEMKIATPVIAIASSESVSKMAEAVTGVSTATMSYGAVALSVVALGIALGVRRK